MKNFVAAMKLDTKNYYRSGIFFVYAIVTIIYIVIIDIFPIGIKEQVALYVILTDPTVLGLFFIGSILMQEKEQGVVDYQVITPISNKLILLSKSILLGLVGLISALSILLVTRVKIDFVGFSVSLMIISLCFSFLGVWVGVTCQTTNQYFGKIIPVMILMVLPCLGVLGFPGHKLLLIFPGYLALEIMKDIFENQVTVFTIFELIGMSTYMIIFWKAATKSFEKRIVYKER